MLLQKIFLQINEKYSITNNEIEDLFDIESCSKDVQIYKIILERYESVLQTKFEALYRQAKSYKNKFNSLVKIFKWKKAINSNIEQDLFLNDINKFKNKYTITILENKTLYKFRISDIVNLWVLALKNTEQLFVKPLDVKNPYTNIEFSKTALYNIYIKLLDAGFIIPNVIASHIHYELDIKMFCIRNYPELKENAILLFMREANFLDKYEEILNMLHDFRKEVDYYTMANLCSINTKKEAVKLFSNHLFLYLESKFSCNPLIKDESKSRVKEKLKKLIEDKPYFGLERVDVIRYVPVTERASVRRRERLQEQRQPSLIRPPAPPPIPSSLRRRRRTVMPLRPPPGLPPPPPPMEPIVRTYTGENTPLPPLQIGNFITRSNDILTRTLTNNNTSLLSNVILNPEPDEETTAPDAETTEPDEESTPINEPTTSTITSSTEEPSYLENIVSSRDRARDLLSQIDEVLGNSNYGFELSLEIENPFAPSRELNRTPPPDSDGSSADIVQPLLPTIHSVNTREIIERLNTVLDREIEQSINLQQSESNTISNEAEPEQEETIETPNNNSLNQSSHDSESEDWEW